MPRRTTIEIDEALLEEAAHVLGTSGLKENVHTALASVVRAQRRRRLAERLRSGDGVDFDGPTAAAARSWRGA